MKYDLEERVFKFSEDIISFLKSIRQNIFNKNIINQLLRSATSVGANYMEANGASSKKDFANKINISRKEANETRYWLRLLSSDLKEKDVCERLLKEAHEITLILATIYRKSKEK